jgi:hypothetical protein
LEAHEEILGALRILEARGVLVSGFAEPAKCSYRGEAFNLWRDCIRAGTRIGECGTYSLEKV